MPRIASASAAASAAAPKSEAATGLDGFGPSPRSAGEVEAPIKAGEDEAERDRGEAGDDCRAHIKARDRGRRESEESGGRQRRGDKG